MSEHKGLRPALAAALAELSNIPRTRTADTGSYQYRFADLGDTLDVVRPVLAKHGLAVDHDITQPDSGHVTATTVFMWGDDELYRSPVTLPHPPSPQAFGSALSYARRYSLTAACGLATEDDDGAAAGGAAAPSSASKRKPKPEPAPPPSPPASPVGPDLEKQARSLGWDDYATQVEAFRLLVEQTVDVESVKTWVKVQHITRDTLSEAQAEAWMDRLAKVSRLEVAAGRPIEPDEDPL